MKNTVLALGYFDSIHRGHQLLLSKAQNVAVDMGGELLICTFGDDFYSNLGKDNFEIFLLSERRKILKSFGYGNLFIFDTSKSFLSQSKEDFLQYLLHFGPKAIVVGTDYSFGKNAFGRVEDLRAFFIPKGIKVEVIDLLFEDNEKISTTLIKQNLSAGNMDKVNRLLNFNYFLTGNVVEGRKDGTKIGIPTANININSKKLTPKAGVYASKLIMDGKTYFGITNIGNHPTFDDNNFNVETHIFDYSGNIYQKEVTISLIKYIREIKKFDSKELLVEQIRQDIVFAKEVLE